MVETCTGRVYNEIIEDTPITCTTAVTAARLVGETYPYKYVLSYVIRVRSMGGASYIGIGTEQGQEYRLTTAGQTYGYNCNRYEVIDLTKKYIISDVAGAVVEVSCSYMPINMYGKVRRVA